MLVRMVGARMRERNAFWVASLSWELQLGVVLVDQVDITVAIVRTWRLQCRCMVVVCLLFCMLVCLWPLGRANLGLVPLCWRCFVV